MAAAAGRSGDVFKVFCQGKVLLRFVEQIFCDFSGPAQGSTALRGAELRSVGLVAPFPDVMKLVQISAENLDIFLRALCIWQSLSLVFLLQLRRLLEFFPRLPRDGGLLSSTRRLHEKSGHYFHTLVR